MTSTYTSGRSRVHATGSASRILAAIREYEDKARHREARDTAFGDLLLSTAADLREELRLRAQEDYDPERQREAVQALGDLA